jgi:hypothetical protein
MMRNNFALARLIALAVPARAAAPQPGVDRVILASDRHQNAAEHYTAAFGYLALVVCFLAAFMPLLLAIPLSLIAIQIPIYAFGIPFNRRRAVAIGYVLCGAAMSWVLVLQPRWIRFAGWAFFAAVALNAVAAVIPLPLRNRNQ